jgi:glycogen debranching enzyme
VSNSQIRFLPFVLGDRLPAEVRAVMSDDLDRSGLVTPYGLASESPASSAFEPDGYWRGAIWAPTNVLVVDGLRRSGLTAQADAIRHAFLGTVARSGVAENYDATDGRALRCPSYTWSAGAFWWLATAVDAPVVDIATEEG